MHEPSDKMRAGERPIVYVRKVRVDDLPEEIRAQASGAGLKELYAIGNEEGEQLALVKDRKLAFVLARALIGRGSEDGLRLRLRRVAPDLASIVMGAAVLLIWAGLVESYFSQHHEPAIPYAVKIAFGTVQLVALCLWLFRAGRKGEIKSQPA